MISANALLALARWMAQRGLSQPGGFTCQSVLNRPSPPRPRNKTRRSRHHRTILIAPHHAELCHLLGQLMIRLLEAKRLKEAGYE